MSEAKPKVSVVVCVYNGADTIAPCIESLLNQTYPRDRYEIIVVENGSTDNTVEVVQRYPVRLLRSPVRGLASARQFGLEHSTGEIYASTDADCRVHPDWISELVKPYADPSIAGVGGAVLSFEHAERNVYELFSDENNQLSNFAGGQGEFLPRMNGCNSSYRRALLHAIGGFNTRMVTGDDTDASWRMQLETGKKLAYAENAIVYHHHRATKRGLQKQYRQYGYAEVLLDTMYGRYAGYPRTRAWQTKRILGQMWALPRYAASAVLRKVRRMRGVATEYQAETPKLWLLAETSNLRGKLDALAATRYMTNAQRALGMDTQQLITQFYQTKKE